MKIVVLDSHPLDAGDLDWTPLRALAADPDGLVLHEQTAPEQVAERITGATVVCTNKVPLDGRAFAAGRADAGSGECARDRLQHRGYKRRPCARRDGVQRARLLDCLDRSGDRCAAAGTGARRRAHARRVRDGAWQQAGIWSFSDRPLVELDGKTLVVVGLGAIGGRVARIASALGMNVVAAQLPGRPAAADNASPYPRLPLDEALPLADAVTLHCPLTPQTHGLMSEARLAGLRPTAFLVNTARGPLVDEHAIALALHAGRLAGYAADVLSVEPPPPDHPLLNAPNCLVTPHLAWATRESRERLLQATVENVRAFVAGAPQNVVG
jgi:glycerate dehydrogenase